MGKEAALAERDGNGPAQRLVTLEIDAEDADASGYEPVWAGEKRVGFVTSGGYGHTVQKSLAMALVDQDQYGLPINVFVSVRLEKQSNEAIHRFEEEINRLDEVLDCYLMTGTRDYLLRVVSQNLKSYEQFVREKLTTIHGVAAIESSFALGRVKQRSILPLLSHFKR